jgi:hypothetical protein
MTTRHVSPLGRNRCCGALLALVGAGEHAASQDVAGYRVEQFLCRCDALGYWLVEGQQMEPIASKFHGGPSTPMMAADR